MHTLLVGKPGSGKSSLAKRLVQLSARVIVLDQRFEYGADNRGHREAGVVQSVPRHELISYDLPEASRFFLAHRWESFELVFRPREPADNMRLLEIALYAQEYEPLAPLVIVAEEASNYSETHAIDPVMRAVYNEGRHLRLSMLTVIQYDTDIHRITRMGSTHLVTMYQQGISGALERHFSYEEIARLKSMEDTGWVPWPEQGVHFLVSPHEPLYETWVNDHGDLVRVEGP